jgi:hypothetical protein
MIYDQRLLVLACIWLVRRVKGFNILTSKSCPFVLNAIVNIVNIVRL